MASLTSSRPVTRGEGHVPGKRLPMRKIGEVLRLKAAGRSVREIAASSGGGKDDRL